MAITLETLRIVEAARKDLQRMTDQHVTSLVGAWVAVWDDLAPEFETSLIDLTIDAKGGYISRAAASRHVRLAKTLDLARQRILEPSEDLEAVVAADLPEVTRRAYASQSAAIGSQLPPIVAVIRSNPDFASAESLGHIVRRSLEQIQKDSRPLADDVVRVMKKELIRGTAVGDNPRRTAGRIVKQTEGRFNGGLTRAMVIARNEVLDGH